MPLNKPYFFLKETDGGTRAYYNCNGGLNFMASSDILDENTKRLIEFAIEEGKRRRSQELTKLLGE